MLFNFDSIRLDRNNGETLQQQLFRLLRDAILSSELRPDARLPASRKLANQLGIARNTVLSCYERLVAEGYLVATTGSGTRVSNSLHNVTQITKSKSPDDSPKLSRRGLKLISTTGTTHSGLQTAFQPGLPALDEFPYALWARFVARNYRSGAKNLFGYEAPGGLAKLRLAIAKYVSLHRAVNCDENQIIVTAGSQAGIDLCARLLLDEGEQLWLENPCYQGAKAAFLGAGAEICPVPVDSDGLDLEYAERRFPQARLAFVTPSYQYPLGVTMSLERRLGLLAWAEKNNSWIIEDDYDSEFRYRGHSISALQGLDTGARVIYMGTFSKTMFPSIRIAYLVVPTSLIESFRKALKQSGQAAALPLQGALADFINEGAYGHHQRRMRQIYIGRQQRFLQLAAEHLAPHIKFSAADAGMHLIGYFNDQSIDDKVISKRAARLGIVAPAISSLYIKGPYKHGLYPGYGGAAESIMASAMLRLASAFEH